MSEEVKDNKTWDSDCVSNFNYSDETQYFQEWLGVEIKCNERSTAPGFYEWNDFSRFPTMTPGAENGEMYPVRWTTYRAEDGTLLVVHVCFVDPQGITKPLIFFTNPEHQRQGYGKIMFEYLKQRYVRETGKLNPNESWEGIKVTTPGAAFANWAGKEITEYNKNTPD